MDTSRAFPYMLLTLLVGSLCAFACALAAPGPAFALDDICTVDCGPGGGPTTETKQLTLTVTNGGGTVTGPSVNCGADCTTTGTASRTCDGECGDWTYPAFTLTAAPPASGYQAHWSSWTGCAPGPTCDVVLTADATVAVTWSDVAAPSVNFLPPAKVGASTTSLTASGTDNSGSINHYTWWVDGAQQGTTGSSLSISSISAGSHTFMVQAFDGAGNGSGQTSKTVVIDRSAGVSVGSLPAITNASTVPLSFTTDSDVVSRSCSLNGGGGVSCTSPWSGIDASTPDGTYAYRVSVTDDVGNTATSAPVTVVLDRTAPDLTFTNAPTEGQVVGTRTLNFEFSSTDAHPATVECSLDSAAFAACDSGADALTGLANGDHTFRVRSTDAAGNTRTLTRNFTVRAGDNNGNGSATQNTQNSQAGGTQGSGAPVACVVPKLKGKKVAAAKKALRAAHCGIGKLKKKHAPRKQRGRVLSQSKKAGSRVAAGTKVALTIGK